MLRWTRERVFRCHGTDDLHRLRCHRLVRVEQVRDLRRGVSVATDSNDWAEHTTDPDKKFGLTTSWTRLRYWPALREDVMKRLLTAGTGPKHAELATTNAAPGSPLCRTCKLPVVVQSAHDGVLEAMCPECSERRRYELPATIRHMADLAGVLADEHEQGVREASLQWAGDVAMLTCPGCNAPLENVREADGLLVCGYCHTHCRVSAHSHARAGHKDVRARTWWLYFQTPSAGRAELHTEAKKKQEERRREEAKLWCIRLAAIAIAIVVVSGVVFLFVN